MKRHQLWAHLNLKYDIEVGFDFKFKRIFTIVQITSVIKLGK